MAEFDPDKTDTNVFYFDGASNVQKAGWVLEKKYPRTFCFHGSEHVTSLFFDDVAKLKPIQVSTSVLFFTSSSCLNVYPYFNLFRRH